MKIMVCGKGGSGKSVIAVLIARALAKEYTVYLIDSDESNALLPRSLGVKPPQPVVQYLGGRGTVFEKGETNLVNALSAAGKGVQLGTLPPEYVSTSNEGINLITIGKVREYGEGCACPLNFLTRTILKHLQLEPDEVVLVDTDAGIEHVGRRVEEGTDAILAVVDPTAESLRLAKTLQASFEGLNRTVWVVLNKATPDVVAPLKRSADELNLEVHGTVRFDEAVFKSCLMGEELKANEALRDVESLLRSLDFFAA